MLKIERVNGELTLFDDVTEEDESQGLLEVVFEDGNLTKETTLGQIRSVIDEQI